MDSNYPLLPRPLWFGTPWHGVVYRDSDRTVRLRPNGTTGDKDRPWSGSSLSSPSLWDIGKPDPITPDEILEQGGAFLGRSLVNPGLNVWRPLLLAGAVCRVRVREDFDLGFTADIQAYDPATGLLGPAIRASTGRFSMDSIGQGTDQPAVAEWTPPALIRTYTGMDVTADGTSLLVGVTPLIVDLEFSQIMGLIRLDIGGTPDAPTLSVSLVASRADTLGEAFWSNEFSAENQSWNTDEPVEEENECGTWRITKTAARHPEGTTSPPGISERGIVTRTGSSVTSRGFSNRILSAWFNSAGQVETVRYDLSITSSFTVTAADESSGTEVTTTHYLPDSCAVDYVSVDDSMVTQFRVTAVTSDSGTLTVGGSSASFSFTTTNEFVWDRLSTDPASAQQTMEGTLDGISDSLSSSGAPFFWMPDNAPVAPATPHSIRAAALSHTLPRGGYTLHPSQAGWKAPALARTRYQSGDAAVEVKLWPAQTPAGGIGSTVTFDYPVLTSQSATTQRLLATRSGVFNPITGTVTRGEPTDILGCI